MKTIHMAIDPRLLRAVDKLTRARKTTRSALIRAAPGTTLSEGSI
jgi:metal-responsive CopG/Arc/MetJ family transcriptional regulator